MFPMQAFRALMYAAIGTRPDIAFAVGALSRFLSNPGRLHWNEAKRVLAYLKGTSSHVIQYSSDTSPAGKSHWVLTRCGFETN
jgi:hypothetical protein